MVGNAKGQGWGLRTRRILFSLPVIGSLILAIGVLFWPIGSDLSTDGNIALRLTVVIAAVVYAVLMRLLFLSHESGLDEKVDDRLSAEDNRPIRSWEDQ